MDSPWSSGFGPLSWLKARSTGETDPAAEDAEALARNEIGSESDKPELLPWRSRLKGYRLGARLVRGKEATGEENARTAAAVPSRKTPSERPLAAKAEPSRDSSEREGRATLATFNQLQLPTSVGSLPESSRPDLVVD